MQPSPDAWIVWDPSTKSAGTVQVMLATPELSAVVVPRTVVPSSVKVTSAPALKPWTP